MFVGLGPGEDEDEEGEPFIGRAGQKLKMSIRKAGMNNREQIARACFTNTVRCIPPNNKPLQRHINACAPYLDEEIQLMKPKVIVPLGTVALKRVLNNKRATITKYRGDILWSETYQAVIAPTYHPAYILREPAYGKTLVADIRQAIQLIEDGYEPPKKKPVHYKIVRTVEEADKLFDQIRKVKLVAVDIETQGLKFQDDAILSVHFSWKSRTAVGLPLLSDGGDKAYWSKKDYDYVLAGLKDVLESDVPKVFQNGKFDTEFFLQNGIDVQNIVMDTLFMSYLLSPHEKGIHGLKFMAYRRTDIGEYGEEIDQWLKEHGSLRGIPDDILFPYGNTDADATFRIAKQLWQEMKAVDKADRESGLDTALCWVHKNIMLPLSKVLTRAEFRGMKIDVDYVEKKTKEYEGLLKEVEAKLWAVTTVTEFEEKRRKTKVGDLRKRWRGSPHIQRRHKSPEDYVVAMLKDKDWKFNPGSNKQLQTILYKQLRLPILEKTASDQPSTAGAVLLKLQDQRLEEGSEAHEFFSTLMDYRDLSKLLSTYFKPLLVLVDSNNRIHTTYLIFGTQTGRLSSKDPNLQNIPKVSSSRAKEVRRAYIASPGYRLVEADFKQVEIRWWAEYAQDSLMISDITTKGFDIHDKIARLAFNVPDDEEVSDLERVLAKTINFGAIYGQAEKTVAEEFGIPENEVHHIYETLMGRYPNARQWIKDVKKFAKKHGKVISWFGRHRPLPGIRSSQYTISGHAERQAVNTPIQSAAADNTYISGFIRTLRLLDQESHLDAYILLNIHDAVVLEVWESDLDELINKLRPVMEAPATGPRGDAKVPMVIEISVGDSLAHMVEIPLGMTVKEGEEDARRKAREKAEEAARKKAEEENKN